MGDMAEMTMDWEEDPEWNYSPRHTKSIVCKSCNKTRLKWRQIQKQWVLFETNGSVHTCHGYEPPIEILKELAKGVIEESKIETMTVLHDKARKRGGLKKILPTLLDDQLVDLYACFIRDEQLRYDNPDVGMGLSYRKEIECLKYEILKRMCK